MIIIIQVYDREVLARHWWHVG